MNYGYYKYDFQLPATSGHRKSKQHTFPLSKKMYMLPPPFFSFPFLTVRFQSFQTQKQIKDICNFNGILPSAFLSCLVLVKRFPRIEKHGEKDNAVSSRSNHRRFQTQCRHNGMVICGSVSWMAGKFVDEIISSP